MYRCVAGQGDASNGPALRGLENAPLDNLGEGEGKVRTSTPPPQAEPDYAPASPGVVNYHSDIVNFQEKGEGRGADVDKIPSITQTNKVQILLEEESKVPAQPTETQTNKMQVLLEEESKLPTQPTECDVNNKHAPTLSGVGEKGHTHPPWASTPHCA